MPCQSCEGHTAGREMLLPLQQSATFHQRLSVGEISQNGTEFKPHGEDGTKEGAQTPLGKATLPKVPQDWMPKA